MNARTLRNAGDLVLASGRVEVGQGGEIENSGTLTVHAQDVSGLPSWQQPGLYDAFAGSRGRLLNTGELLKTTGSGRTQVTLQVDNDGTVDAQSGQMLFGGGGYGGQTGSWSASGGGSSLVFGGDGFSLNRPSGRLIFSSGSITAASLDSAGETVSVLDGSVSLSDGDGTSQAQRVELSGGTLSVAGTLDASELALSGGTLGGAGTVSASDSFDWTGGSMSGLGVTELTGTASGSIHPATGSLVTMNQRTLRNEGTLDFDSGRVEIGLGGLIDNAGTLTLDPENGVPGVPSSTQPGLYDAYWGDRARLRNTGTVRESHGTGSTNVGPQVDNRGTIDAETGQMLFGGGGYGEQTGSWSASGDDSSLVFGGGAFSLNRPSGQLIFSSATVTADSLDSAGENVSVLGGSVAVTDANATSTAGSVTIDGDGSFSVAGTLDTTDLTMTGGTLGGSGTVSVTGELDWTRGSMTGPGITELAQNASGSIHPPTGSTVTLYQRTLQSAGALNFDTGRVEVGQGGAIDNHGTATIDTENVPGLPAWQQPGLYDAFQGARGRFNNTGTTRKHEGTGTTEIGPQFDNHGTAEADSGKLVFTGGGIPGAGVPEFPECPFQPQIQDGTWAAASGAEIDFSGGCYKLGGNTQISGNVSISGAYLTAPDIQASASSTLSITDGKLQLTDPETRSHVQHLNMSGAGTLTGDGTIAIGEDCSLIGGTMSGGGTTIISPAASCIIDPGPNGSIQLERGLINEGTMTWASGSIVGSAAVRVENEGAFRTNSEAVQGFTSSGPEELLPILINTGDVDKLEGTGTTQINVPTINRGTIQASSGDIRFNGADGDDVTEDVEEGRVVRTPAGRQIDPAHVHVITVTRDIELGDIDAVIDAGDDNFLYGARDGQRKVYYDRDRDLTVVAVEDDTIVLTAHGGRPTWTPPGWAPPPWW